MGVGGRDAPGDSATVRVTLAAASGCRNVEQRVMRFGRGRSKPRQASCEDVWYVVSGRGVLRLDTPPRQPGDRAGQGGPRGPGWTLEPEMGVLLPPGVAWTVDNHGADKLAIVSVQVPAIRGSAPPGAAAPGAAPAIVRLATSRPYPPAIASSASSSIPRSAARA
jgi:mannose-6-phosphate isomerase-like protein (cupin superfamily)